MKTMKKIGAILVIGMLSLTGLVGCTTKETTYTQEQVEQMVKNATENATENVDITKDNDKAVSEALKNLTEEGKIVNASEYMEVKESLNETKESLEERNEEIERIKQVLEDYKEEEEKRETELEEKENKEEIETSVDKNYFPVKYDNGEIEKLMDTEIEHNDEDYDVEETIKIGESTKLETSLYGDEEFGKDPYVIFDDEESLRYGLSFDESVKNISKEESLTVDFLGEEMTITSVGDNEIEVLTGQEEWINTNETLEIDGNEIAIVDVDTNGEAAGVEVNGNLMWIDEGKTETIDDVDVRVNKVYTMHGDGGSVKLAISTADNVYETIEDGDSATDEENDRDAEWVYNIVSDEDDGLTSIGVVHNQKVDELDDDFKPLGVGDELYFPNDYVSLKFDSINVDNYEDVEVSFDEIEDTEGEEHPGVILTADENIFNVDGEEVSEVKLSYNVGKFYEDDGDIIKAENNPTIVNKEMSYEIDASGNENLFVITVGDNLEFTVELEDGEYHLGDEEGDDESSKVIFYKENYKEKIGSEEYDVLGNNGMVIYSPEDNGEDDEVKFSVPNEKLEATLLLG